jgi:hypothetical protein
MRIHLAAILLFLAAPAAAQKPAESQDSPITLLEALGMAPDPDAVRRAVAAAESQPLGSERNPVRVAGPAGERAYIARLRCADGASPRVGQRGSAGIGVFGTIIDIYPLDCGDAAPGRVSLVMDMYHGPYREDRPAAGFTILPR